MASPRRTLRDWLRPLLSQTRTALSDAFNESSRHEEARSEQLAAQEEVQAYLAERRTSLCHWLFLVRVGLALGLAGYLAVSALATSTVWPGRALLVAGGYVTLSGVARYAVGCRHGVGPWLAAAIDAALVPVLYAFWGGVFGTALAPGVALVGLWVLLLLAYTLLGNPTLSAALSLAALLTTASIFYLFPNWAAGALPEAEAPIRSFLLIEYLSIACLVTCLLALRLRRRLVAYSTELFGRVEASMTAQLEEKRRRQAEALGQIKRDFITVLSHELRNPMGPLISSLEAVQADAHEGRPSPVLTDVAVDAADEIQQLVGDYTQLAKLLTRPLEEAKRRNVPLAPLAEGVAAQLTERFCKREEGCPVFASKGLEDAAVAADPPLLHHTLHALMRRAAAYSGTSSTVTVRALTGEEVEPDEAGFAVHDPDSHLSEDTLDALDDLFAASDERLYARDATGLELLLARHALRRVGGRLRVESDPACGTTAYCILPAPAKENVWVERERVRAFASENLSEAPVHVSA